MCECGASLCGRRVWMSGADYDVLIDVGPLVVHEPLFDDLDGTASRELGSRHVDWWRDRCERRRRR